MSWLCGSLPLYVLLYTFRYVAPTRHLPSTPEYVLLSSLHMLDDNDEQDTEDGKVRWSPQARYSGPVHPSPAYICHLANEIIAAMCSVPGGVDTT